MSKNKTLRQEVLGTIIDKTLRDIEHQALFIGYYESLVAAETDTKKKGGLDMKLNQMKDTMELNQKSLEYFMPLLSESKAPAKPKKK